MERIERARGTTHVTRGREPQIHPLGGFGQRATVHVAEQDLDDPGDDRELVAGEEARPVRTAARHRVIGLAAGRDHNGTAGRQRVEQVRG